MLGLTEMDVPEALQEMSNHLAAKGEWRKGVISPSLVATTCPLARVKIFLGLDPNPQAIAKRMNLRAGKADFGSTVSMTRGFAGEALMLAALKRALPVEIIAHAPTFEIAWDGPDGTHWAGHPDALMARSATVAQFEMIQIKTPTGFKLDRIEKYGEQDALNTYIPQMATEMYIARKSGLNVIANYLLLFSWESTPKSNRPRVKVIKLDWSDELATIPEQAAFEVQADAGKALLLNQWPAAYPTTSWDVWPCSYCRFARLGDFETPACDDHDRWRSHGDQKTEGQGRTDVTASNGAAG